MLGAPTFDDIQRSLAYYFEKGRAVRLVGVLFCRPEADIAKGDILPSVPYYHYRSGESTNFYFAGYREGSEPESGEAVAIMGDYGPKWLFSPKAFDELRRDLESRTKWRYSGGTDLILVNARRAEEAGQHIDFSTAIVLNLELLQKDAELPNVSMLFEEIFRYAEDHGGDDPVWGLSDRLGMETGGRALGELLLMAVPQAIRDKIRPAFHYYVTDIGA